MLKKRFMIHSAVTIMPVELPGHYIKVYNPLNKLFEIHLKTIGEEKEIEQLCVDCTSVPMRESHFREAFDEMRERCLEAARKADLVISK